MKSIVKTLSAYNAPDDNYLKGRNYLFVIGDNTPPKNALELKQTINLAKQIQPNKIARSATNQMTILVAPGNYPFGATKLVLDTPYINIVSLTGNMDVFIDGLSITGNNIFVRGIDAGTNAFTITGTGVTVENSRGLNYVSDIVKADQSDLNTTNETVSEIETDLGEITENILTNYATKNELSAAVEGTNGWCGVRWNPKLSSTSMTRVGDENWEQLFEDCKVVSLNDDGTEGATLATYADPTITGATDEGVGQIMVRIPRKYYREIFNSDGELCGLDMSNLPLGGFRLHEKFAWGNGRSEIYVGAFEASLDTAKLQSSTGFSLLTSVNMRQFNNYAVARGTGWHGYDYFTNQLLQTMFYIYYANLNSQLVLPAYSEHAWMDGHEKRETGRTVGLTTMNGYVNAQEGADDDIATGWNGESRVIANRFMWVENLYGHVWKFLDGCSFDGRIGKKNTAFLTANPLLFSSVEADIISKYTDMNIDLPASPDSGWQGSLGVALLPKSFAGDSSTNVTDYLWSYLDNETLNYMRVVFAGGRLDIGASGGVAARYAYYALALASAKIGSRLCYEKN